MGMLKALLLFLRSMFVPRVHLAVENLALRQQLAVCRQSIKRPKLLQHRFEASLHRLYDVAANCHFAK